MSILPIEHILPELLRTVQAHPNTVLSAPPGAGKTTRVPLALLSAIPAEAGRIVMLEPRRIAAVAAARFMADTLGEPVGQTVGYAVRFERKVSPRTRIEVVTEGMLTRRIQDDPSLSGVACVIFDEFHERSIHADLGLALCLEAQSALRDDLKLVVMSATLETEPLVRLLGNAPLVASQGRSFPVEVRYVSGDERLRLPQRMATAIRQALATEKGDLLAFLPGSGEIRAVQRELGSNAGVLVCPLYGDLSLEAQRRAILPGTERRVVLATSIAETSLTIDGVRVVVDCGLSRRQQHDPASGLERLVTVRSSKASALQRTGRAGRTAPGVCYRLYSEHSFTAMTAHTPPEMLTADLAPLLLELAAWGTSAPRSLPWLDPPPAAALAGAAELLRLLGALSADGRITPLGREMVRLPVHPRLARLLLEGKAHGVERSACRVAALLSGRDPFRREAAMLCASDLSSRLERLEQQDNSNEILSLRRIEEQLLRLVSNNNCNSHLNRLLKNQGCSKIVRSSHPEKAPRRRSSATPHVAGFEDGGEMAVFQQPLHSDAETLAPLVLAAWPDRLAMKRVASSEQFLLASGRGARLSPHCGVRQHDLLVALQVDGGSGAEGVIHLASAVTTDQIRHTLPGLVQQVRQVCWDESAGRVTAAREERIGAVILSSRQVKADDAEALPLLLEQVQRRGMASLGWTTAARQLQGRVLLAARLLPEEGWPEFSDAWLLEHLADWLGPCLSGLRSRQELERVDLLQPLREILGWKLPTTLDTLAPTTITVPSGRSIALDYSSPEGPVLAVKLQELFGLADSPTICRGRMAVLVHLLSPAGRPVAITRDLKGFWERSYPEVRKELRGRYPKHPWPDDPWNAPATQRTKAGMARK